MSLKKIRGIIFDLDGTLIDSVNDLCVSINFGREHFGLNPLPNSVISSYVGDGIDNLILRSFADSEIETGKAKPVVTAHYEKNMMKTTSLYPGVKDTLPVLPQSKIIVTNKPEKFVAPILDTLGIIGHFTAIIGGDTLPDIKPHKNVGLTAIKMLSLKPDEIIVVGDHSTDLELALNCGMKSVFCKYGIGRTNGKPATWTINAFSELTQICQLSYFDR